MVVKNNDPAPQDPAAGKEVTVVPEINCDILSVKNRSVSADVVLLFVIVNSTVVVLPAGIGSLRKVLVMVGTFSINKSAVATFPITVDPSKVALIVPVVFVYVPRAAPAGTWTGTLKLHELSGANEPPEKDKEVVPERIEPIPHILFNGVPVAVNPANTVVRSSVNDISVAVKSRLKLVNVNSRLVLAPGNTGLGLKDFWIKISGGVNTSNCAEAIPQSKD